MGSQITIVIADDHRLIRESLHQILDREKNIRIVGEAAVGPEAIRVIGDLKPDIVLLDIFMPELDGFEAVPRIRAVSPDTGILVLPRGLNEDNIFKVLNAGAKGYISEDASLSDLVKAILAVHKGELWVERKLISRFFDRREAISAESELQEHARASRGGLTAREQEVLGCLTKGLTNKEIANELIISEKTVKSHLNSIFRKLNVTRRLEAILYAIKKDLA